METARLFVSLVHYPVYTLGPGVRVGLWTQGCRIRCKGCMSEHTWEFREETAMPIAEVAQRLRSFGCPRLTISGGEPLDQAEALRALLTEIRPSFSDVLLYTGYRMEKIRKKWEWVLTLVDAVVDSPFRLGLETDALHKGSANQRFFLLNPALKALYLPWASAKKDKKLQVAWRPEGVYIIGIPYQRDSLAIFSSHDPSPESPTM